MNDRPAPNGQHLVPDRWESAVQAAARAFPYPPTPDLARSVRTRLQSAGVRPEARPVQGRRGPLVRPLAWALAALVLVLAGLFAVPQVRARIIDFLQIGGIRIFVTPPTATPVPPPAQTPAAGSPAAATRTPTPRPTPTPLASVLDLAGETTLEAAQAAVPFKIGLPSHPAGLGPPDRVFLQRLGGPVVVLVWTAPGQPDRVRLSLQEFGPRTFAEKLQPSVVLETIVGGAPAVWTEGPHLFLFRSGEMGPRELVRGHTLIWQQDDVTYRLETDEDLAEAVRIAESVRS